MTLLEVLNAEFKPKHGLKIVERYKRANGVNLTWESLDQPYTLRRLNSLAKLIKNETTANNAYTQMAQFKAILNRAEQGEYGVNTQFAKGWKSAGRVKKEPSEAVALTSDDIRRIKEYAPGNERFAYIQNVFRLCLKIGCRYSEIESISPRHVKNHVLTFFAKKNKKMPTVKDVDGSIYDLLLKKEKYETKHGGSLSLQAYNEGLKEISKAVGLTEEITLFRRGRYETIPKYKAIASHTARRTQVTLLIEAGEPIANVSKRLGHSGINMTQRYFCGTGVDSDIINDYVANV